MSYDGESHGYFCECSTCRNTPPEEQLERAERERDAALARLDAAETARTDLAYEQVLREEAERELAETKERLRALEEVLARIAYGPWGSLPDSEIAVRMEEIAVGALARLPAAEEPPVT